MKTPCYINMNQARAVLAEIGIELTPRQIKRAADPDAHGRRKLPFFPDPITGRLRIERSALLDVYMSSAIAAENNSHNRPGSLKNSFDGMR